MELVCSPLTNAHICNNKATAIVGTCQLLPSIGKESMKKAAVCRCNAMSPLQSLIAISSLMFVHTECYNFGFIIFTITVFFVCVCVCARILIFHNKTFSACFKK